MVLDQRVSAAPEGDFVVFLVGMRFRWRQVSRWWAHFQAMSRMVSELNHDPESGYLGGESWIGNPTIMVQYWRSFEHLRSYAHNPDRHHKHAWAAFNAALANGADLGVWHEAYQVRASDYFTLYNRMPPFGLARATRTIRPARRRPASQRQARTVNAQRLEDSSFTETSSDLAATDLAVPTDSESVPMKRERKTDK